MTINEAKAINEKLIKLVEEYPELNLTAKVTFTEDPLVTGEHNVYISITNGCITSDQEVEFCKEHDMAFAQYVNGHLEDSCGALRFEDCLSHDDVQNLVYRYYHAKTGGEKFEAFQKIGKTVMEYNHRDDKPENFFQLTNILVMG